MSVYAICFSPTRGTERIVKIVADEFKVYEKIDLSQQDLTSNPTFKEEDICIIGVPSYGGRVPSIALERMNQFQGNNVKTILIVAYGNRDYDDTLKELLDFTANRGFSCIAAITAIAKHSIMPQFATHRPDKQDESQLVGFTKKILDKLKEKDIQGLVDVPGHFPYKEYKGVPLKPKASKKCTNCGICAKQCPVGAIPINEPSKTNKDLCITCMRCVTICPSKARKLNPVLLKVASNKLKQVCIDRKENELFI